MTGPDLTDLSAVELGRRIRARQVSCVDVVTAHLDRIDTLDERYHACNYLRPRSEVLAAAADADAELDRGHHRGWMHGLPHAVKDLADVEGLPTTLGFFSAQEAPVAVADEPFVGQLRSAGAVFIGKTNTPEFGLGSHSYNAVFPTTGNIACPERSAGGSSGGAAVAVAAGFVPVADGSDFMGSLRNPPGWNGVLGLRPSPGLVVGVADPTGLPVDGPIARSIDDLTHLLATMAAHPVSSLQAPTPARSPRVGWLGDLGGLPFEDGVLDVCLGAVRRWSPHVEDIGIESLMVDHPGDLWTTWLTFRHESVGSWLTSTFSADEIGLMKPEARWEIAGFRSLTERDRQAAAQSRASLQRAVRHLFTEHDLLMLPTAQVWPFPKEQPWPTSIGPEPMDTYHRWMQVTTLASLAGTPTLAVPAGTNAEGLHIGLQVLGAPGADATLLAWGRRAESRGEFAVAPPSVAAGVRPAA